jgi:hypothetical protein
MNPLFKPLFLFLLFTSCTPNESIKLEQDERVERFIVSVNTEVLNGGRRLEEDRGILILPKVYSDNGSPVKLVIYCHGGGGSVLENTSQAETYIVCNYLVSLGYAVMDMAGMPEDLSRRLKIDHYRVLGNPIAISSYEKGYKYVIENFNIDPTGCYLLGGSNGGLISCNLVNFTNIPFIAQAGLAPLLSIEKNAWDIPTHAMSGGEFSYRQNRVNIIRLYGMKAVFTQDDVDKAIYEKDKVGKYDPYDYLINSDKGYKIPFKIWHSVDDASVMYKISEAFMEIGNKKNSTIVLRTLLWGGHAPESYGKKVCDFSYMGRINGVNEILVEIAEWLCEHGGLPVTI